MWHERRTGHGRVVGHLLGVELDFAIVELSNELLSEEAAWLGCQLDFVWRRGQHGTLTG